MCFAVFTDTQTSTIAPSTIKLTRLRKSGKKTRSSLAKKLQRFETMLMDNPKSFPCSIISSPFSSSMPHCTVDLWTIPAQTIEPYTPHRSTFFNLANICCCCCFFFYLLILFFVKILQKSRFIQSYYILIPMTNRAMLRLLEGRVFSQVYKQRLHVKQARIYFFT